MIRAWSAQVRGVLDAIRGGNADAHALAVGDSRAYVRALFLASAVRLDVLGYLTTPRTIGELRDRTGATREDRLAAWLDVGVELHELRATDGRYVARGRRARALAGGDAVLNAHYRSMLDYQPAQYRDAAALLREPPGAGRGDLEAYATVIAEVSRAAAPFVRPFLRQLMHDLVPDRVLDAGCGTGVYLHTMLDACPTARGVGIDLAADVVAEARERLHASALADRASVHVGEVRIWLDTTADRFELITLVNNVYYFDRAERVDLYRRMRAALTDRGELVLVTMVTPGSPASAHLHLMLVSQAGHASLPLSGEVERDLRLAGFTSVETTTLVPTEPFVGIRAR
jgi:4-hydroxy-2,2'-bipyrrole-5-carbaldehyde O-methyltransferase